MLLGMTILFVIPRYPRNRRLFSTHSAHLSLLFVIPRYPRDRRLFFPSFDGFPFIRRSALAEEPHPSFYNSRYARLRILSECSARYDIFYCHFEPAEKSPIILNPQRPSLASIRHSEVPEGSPIIVSFVISAAKSFQKGFIELMSWIFFSLRHFFSCFSRMIAE